MYSIVEVAGHQYKVKAGDVIDVEKLEQEVGAIIELDKVLFTAGEKPQVGLPIVAGAKVKAKVIRMARDRKIVVYKRKPSHRDVKNGHRQHYTALLITEIDNGQGEVSKIDNNSKEAQKHLK
jgi:large subunit ribosomal protein L21